MVDVADLFQLCRSDPYFLRYSGIKKIPGLYSKSPVFFVFFEKMGPIGAPKAGSGGLDLD